VQEIIQQKDLFNDPLFDRSRWPKRPYCTDDPATYGTRIRDLKQALTRAYIQATHRTFESGAFTIVTIPERSSLGKTTICHRPVGPPRTEKTAMPIWFGA